jgi:5-methylcytosine-specific restriction protein B
MQKTPSYWLFQANPKVFRLRDALRAEVLKTVPIQAHKSKIKEGDKVILWESGQNGGCYGLATIASEVGDLEIMDGEKKFYRTEVKPSKRAKIKVDYNIWNKPITKEILPKSDSFDQFYAGTPGTNFKATKAQFEELKELINQLDLLEDPQNQYLVRKEQNHPLNLILYGPPGTGKTFQTINYALSIIENRSLSELEIEPREALRDRFEDYLQNEQIAFVTFHQSFSYEDFVEGIKPVVKKKNVVYKVEPGVFKLIANKALQSAENESNKKFVIVLDELNRGNVASIFGELITLIETDKRSGGKEALQAILPYSKERFSVPSNLYILATMNTTDRSVESLDIALRRRFDFVEMSPRPEMISQIAKKPVAAGVDLKKLLVAINQRIEVLLDRDYCIGHSYFLNVETLNDLKEIFSKKIIPLLQEYFFNDYGKIGLILGQDFIEEKQYSDVTIFANFDHEFANDLAEKKVFKLREMKDLTEVAFIRIYDKEY